MDTPPTQEVASTQTLEGEDMAEAAVVDILPSTDKKQDSKEQMNHFLH